MTTFTVSTSAGLLSALKTAHGGDTVLLTAGSYAPILIYNYHPSGTINITSASASSPATITQLTVSGSSSLKFSNLNFTTSLYNAPTSTAAPTPFQVQASNNISFNQINVHGSMDNNPQDDVNGMRIQNSSNVTITNSQFQQLYNAITDLNNTNLVISNNKFHDLRNDAIDNGGSSNVVISGNTFTNFYPVGAVGTTGDHADAIQFWTSNTTADVSNIIITNNSYVRGSGAGVQGIFIADQVGVHFNNVTVTGNSIIGSEYNAIDVAAANNLNVSNNLVSAYADMINYITIANSTQVTANNNITPALLTSNTTFTSQLYNQIVGAIAPVTSYLGLPTPITTVAETGSVGEWHSTTGNALAGDVGSGLYLADVGIGAGSAKLVASTGSTFKGTYGTLTIGQDGSYSYVVNSTVLTAGQTYDDHFSLTVANNQGSAHSSTLDILVTGGLTGTAGADTMIGGAGVQSLTGGLGADHITSGTGPDTFVYNSLADSPAAAHDTIIGFKAGDVIDLAGVDPNFQIVSKFDRHPNELVLLNDGNGAWDVYGDTTGTGVANFQIHLTGATTTLSSANIHI